NVDSNKEWQPSKKKKPFVDYQPVIIDTPHPWWPTAMAITANNWSSPSRNIKLKLRSKQPQQFQQPSQQPGEPQLQRPLQPTMTGARAALRPPQQNQQAVNVSPGNGNLMVGQNFWEEWQRLIALETEKRVAQQLEEECQKARVAWQLEDEQ
ncbi:hypothetical protein FRB94_003525, partial [Tulasnella sp. JGI-2019a]